MTKMRRILCPVDFSEGSRHALDHAVAIAKWYGGSVWALHVVATLPVFDAGAYGDGGAPPLYGVPDIDRKEIQARLTEFVSGAHGQVSVETMTVDALQADTTILERAQGLAADLLVMGTHGRTGFRHFLLGSVTERVLRIAACPVLTVPPGAPDAVPVGQGLFQRVLCAVDGSPSSMNGLQYALDVAREARGSVTVVSAIEFPPVSYEPMVPPLFDAVRYQAAQEEGIRAELRKAMPPEVRALQPVREVIVVGKAYREILRIAEEERSGLIVMGVHGRGALDRMFFGSTAQHVVRAAGCPVLTIRQG